MGALTVVIYTTGVAGSGKTYVRCARFICDELLPYSNKKLISNYPLYREKIADFVAANFGMKRDEALERLESIPHEVLESWRLEKSGPWEYFKTRDIAGCHIAIDEIHNFCGKHQSKEHRRNWQLWLGEIRHRGATVEFLTQNPQKVAKEVDFECGLRYRIENCEAIRDPILGITCSDWYELRAAFITGKYIATIHQRESVNVDGKWVGSQEKNYVLDPRYFELYDSFSTPVTGGAKGASELRDFQKYGKVRLIAHVFRRNGWPLTWRLLVGCGLMWLCFFGGFGQLMRHFQEGIRAFWEAKHPVSSGAVEDSKKAGSPASEKRTVEKKQVSESVVKGITTNGNVSTPLINVPVSSMEKLNAADLGAVLKPVSVASAPVAAPPVKPDRISVLCVASWDGGAAFDELGSLLIGEVVNGFKIEKCNPRGAVLNGVFCRVGVQTWIDCPAGFGNGNGRNPGFGKIGGTPSGGELPRGSAERTR